MQYPTSVASFNARYPEVGTTLYTPLALSTDPASKWTYDHCADVLAIRIVTTLDAPPELMPFHNAIQRRFQENTALFNEIMSYGLGDEICISPDEIFKRTPLLSLEYASLAIAIENAPQIVPDDQRAQSTRSRVPVAREGFVHDMTMVDFGTSDPISSEYEIPDDTYTLGKDDSGKQELPVQVCGVNWLMGVNAKYNAAIPDVLQRRPQFTTISRRIKFYIPGAELRSESRDDCGAVWRGPDPNARNHRMTTLYMPTVVSIEAKSRKKDAYAQWVAELVAQMKETGGYAKVDFNDRASISKLTEAQRTKFVLSMQGVYWQWVWTTFSVEWIEAMLGSDSPFGKRPRIGDPAPESEPELPGSIQDDDSQEQFDEDAMSGVELDHFPLPYLKVKCAREFLFTDPKDRLDMLVYAEANLQFAINNEVESGQAYIAGSP